jgi:hypothetical protein
VANKLPWFTHDHNARRDEFVQKSMDKFGHFGYAAYFMLLEVIHEHGVGGVVRMTKSRLAQNLRSKWPQVHLYLDFCRTSGKVEVRLTGDEVELQNKKFIERQRKSKANAPATLREGSAELPLDRDREGYIPLPLFDAFWESYPTHRRQRRKDTLEVWASIKGDSSLAAAIVAAVKAQAATDEWRKDKGVFVPSPVRWLRGERWNDAVTPPASPSAAAAKCFGCVARPVAPGARVCDECAWCVECDAAGRPSKRAASEFTASESGRPICRSCAQPKALEAAR